ncbi:MAG TPA: hypothetical protein VIJ82_16915 [Streptosporangiaceae bacterium]|jgi:ABC-2 type transport system permease protein
MSTPAVASPDLSSRRAPGLGGFNMTALGLEIRRFTRNRRTLVFVLIMPIVLFLLFGVNASFVNQRVGHGNVSAFIMISIALYGAALATTSGGAMVAIERAAGWSRQLRLTPLAPAAYIAIKLLAAMMLGLISVVVVYAIGRPPASRRCPVTCGWPPGPASGSAHCCSRPSGCSSATCCPPRTSCSSWASSWRC